MSGPVQKRNVRDKEQRKVGNLTTAMSCWLPTQSRPHTVNLEDCVLYHLSIASAERGIRQPNLPKPWLPSLMPLTDDMFCYRFTIATLMSLIALRRVMQNEAVRKEESEERNGRNTEKNGFVKATNLGTTNQFFVALTKNFAAAAKRFVDRTKHFVVVTKYFCCPYLNK